MPTELSRSPLRWALALLATAVGYALLGRLALVLTLAPNTVSPIFPAAGLALAAVLVCGWRITPAIFVGSLMFELRFGVGGDGGAAALPLSAAVALGAALQAVLGARLVERFVRQPLTLSEPRDIAGFFALGAFAACTLNASLATALFAGVQGMPRAELPFAWLNRWVSESLGTLIATPIVLTLIGRPRAAWVPRRLTVGLTLTVAAGLLGGTILQVLHWEEARARANFDREAEAASTVLASRLKETLLALEAMRSVYLASGDVDRTEMRAASAAWLGRSTPLQALGYAQRTSAAAIPQLEAQARADGHTGYQVQNRTSNAAEAYRRVPFAGELAFAVRQVEPQSGNLPLLGLNLLSVPQSRRAIEQAVSSGAPSATAALPLAQDLPPLRSTGVIVYLPVGEGESGTAAERAARTRGVVFATLRIEKVLQVVRRQVPSYLDLCLFDAEPGLADPLLAGAASCRSAASGYVHESRLAFAGRTWHARIAAAPGALTSPRRGNAWLFAVIGLVSASVLGALLLTVTGRTRRIEAAVRERTAALEQEVREREQAEAAMRESEQRFRNIFNNVPLGVVYTDLDGKVKQTNPHFCELVGHSAEALLAMNARDFTHPDEAPMNDEVIRQLVAGESATARQQKRFVTGDGRVLWVQATLSLLRDEAGVAQRVVCAAEDITENLRLADADRARRAAEASNLAKSEFLSRMSHELRTPLNAMLGFAQLLDLDRRNPLNDAQRPWVGQIQHAGWHLLEMINDVLDLSRIESGNLRLEVEPLDVAELLSATLPLLEGNARARRIIVSQDLSTAAQRFLGDATRVKQILTNLLSNAIKYNIDGGRVHVASARVGDSVELTVTDTGLGMTPKQMKELFQPFNRLGREGSDTAGTGIGLVISQRLAELMGGGLHARSTTGVGSSFVLLLPFVEDPDTMPSPFDAPAADAHDYHLRRVHYVEDNETNIEVMRGILAQRPQVRLEVSMTGLDGLTAIRAQRPDMILLDMHLPDISGMELLRHLRQDVATADIPVVVVSADALASQIAEAVALGASRYLTKPLNVAEVLAVIDGSMNDTVTRFG